MTEKEILKALESRSNILLLGPAGVGKSYYLKKYIESHDNVLVVAPTGMAALNIRGETAHKIFHIPVPSYESPSFAKNKKGAITKSQLNTIALADTLVIDEVSMLRNDAFSFMIKVLRKAEKVKGSKIRVIASGDFMQLPPVVKKAETKLMKKFCFDVSGYAFTTPEWQSLKFKVVELTEIKRQSDEEFIEHLNEIRAGKFKGIDYFKRFTVKDKESYIDTQLLYNDSVCLCGTNAEAERINTKYLNTLPGSPIALQSVKEGRTSQGLIDDIILIKPDAKVIFITNDPMGRFKNGTFGTVKEIQKEYVSVEIGGSIERIYKHDFNLYSYQVKGGKLEKNQTGCIHQFPFKIGKAITIHKSQGQTFDKLAISPEIFAAGQLYVALSRVRTPEGLTLLDEIKPEHLFINETVVKFYKNGYKWDITKKVSQKKSTIIKLTKKATTTKIKTSVTKKSNKTPKKTCKQKKDKNNGTNRK